MDGVDVRDLGRADHCRNVEITLRQLWRAYANRLIGKTYVQRIPVGLTVDRDGADAEFLARADDPQRNLAAICYQNFLEHDVKKALSGQLRAYFVGRTANSSWPYSMGWPLATSFLTNSPATSHSISFISFMASTMHNTWPTSNGSPTFTKGGEPGEGDS